MKLLMIFLFLFSAILLAQPGPPVQVLYVAADPSGACGPAYITENVTTGVQTACINGTWTQNNNAGTGSGTVLSVVIVGTAGQITATGTCTITVSGTCTLSIPSTFTFPGTVTNPLSIFGATTSAQLAGVISDETGTGALVFATSPSFTTPNIGTATGSITGNAATATAATNIAGGSSGQIPYQSGAGVTAFDSGLAFNSGTKALGIIGTITSGQGGTAQGLFCANGATSGSVCTGAPAVAGAAHTILWPTAKGTANQLLKTDGGTPEQLSWVTGSGGATIATTTSTLKGDGAGNGVAVTGTGTDCVLVNGSSGPCGTGSGDTITSPNTTINVGGTTTNTTLDVNTAIIESLAQGQTMSPNSGYGSVAAGTLTVTLLPSPGAFVDSNGYALRLRISSSNAITTGTTLTVAGLGAKTILRPDGVTAFSTGDMITNVPFDVNYVPTAAGGGGAWVLASLPSAAGSGLSGQTTNCLPKAASATTSTSSSSVCDDGTTVTTTEPIKAPSVSTGSSPPALAWFTGTSGIVGLPDGTCTGTVPASAAFICNNGGVLTQYRSTGAIPILISAATGVQTFLTTPSGANLAAALTTALPNTKGGTGADSSAFTGYAKVAAGVWSASVIAAADLPAALTNSTSINGVTMGTAAGAATIAQTIASGTTTASGAGSLNNLGSIASTACATLTVAATGVATTDVISFTPNASLNAVVGFVPATTGGINIVAHPTAGNVVFDACNWSSGALTIGTGAALNWRVSR